MWPNRAGKRTLDEAYDETIVFTFRHMFVIDIR